MSGQRWGTPGRAWWCGWGVGRKAKICKGSEEARFLVFTHFKSLQILVTLYLSCNTIVNSEQGFPCTLGCNNPGLNQQNAYLKQNF